MHDAFVSLVISVCEERAPFGIRRLVDIDGKPVVLGGNKTPASTFVSARLVDTAVSVLHLES